MPTSRNEDILNAILNDDISALPNPQSREEALLIGILEKIRNSGGSAKDFINICTDGEYNGVTGVPTIDAPSENIIYMVPSSSNVAGNLFDEWIYVNNKWERLGPVKYSTITDVRVNGVSVVNEQDIASIPVASSYTFGVVRIGNGFNNDNGIISPYYARPTSIKYGSVNYDVIVPANQHESVFYGLARAAGDTTQPASNNTVGNYTESAKSAIGELLEGSITVSGTTPVINAKSGVHYVCGEVATIEIIPPARGVVDVLFESGATPTVLTVPNGIKWNDNFDSENLDANTVYEIRIRDGLYASVTFWS